MLLKTETIWMVTAIVGIVYFVITVVGFIYCKIRNITCCHQPHQETRAEFKMEREKGNRESIVCGDQDPALQRYVKNPKADTKLRSQESDEQGEPKYDYAVTGEISICTCSKSQERKEESSSHKKENTGKNETETTKNSESAVIEDTKVKRKEKAKVKRPIKRACLKSGTVHYENETVNTSMKKEENANANRPDKRTCLKSGIVHYENESVNTSVNKTNDDIENESVSDKSYVRMRNTDTGSASGQSENERANTSSNKRHGNESNLYESMHDMPYKMMTAVDIDIEAYNDDCMSTPERGISDKMSHIKLNTDRENGSEQTNDDLPLQSSYMENKDNVHDERFENMDSYSTRESQGSDLSTESRKSDESEESNDSNNSRSTDISVRSDNNPRESAPTNSGQDNHSMSVHIYANNVQLGPKTIVYMQKD